MFQCTGRCVVHHGNFVTKYTTIAEGCGPNDTPNEAVAKEFVRQNTTIPVPKVISSRWGRINMEDIEGMTLQQAWPVFSNTDRETILSELKGHIAQLQGYKAFTL